MDYIKKVLFTGFLLVFLNSTSVYAAAPDGSAKIRLSGKVAHDVDTRPTIKQIESAGLVTIQAYNPYDKKTDSYSGVWLDQLVKKFSRPGIKSVTTIAIDDYEAEFLADEWGQAKILLATRKNGEYIGYEQKGPLRVIYPDYDPDKQFYQESLAKWVWMINKIEFK